MKVHLTFDVEIWCNGWAHLDRDFPAAYERYVFGRSPRGEYALPATLEILQRHGLRGVFFVEPLFAARFGARYLERIVRMIESAGQEVQLHLHPEWTDEIDPMPIDGARTKRQHLCYYSREEQTRLLQFGLGLLAEHSQSRITAFRAGSYAANLDTYHALAAVGLAVDSSLNPAFDISCSDLPTRSLPRSSFNMGSVQVVPVTVFRDGLGRMRPAQVGACSLMEMTQALHDAAASGLQRFVFVSHNFEMLKPGRSDPDRIVVRRFEGLCRHLAQQRDTYPVAGFHAGEELPPEPEALPRVSLAATLARLAEQAARRWN